MLAQAYLGLGLLHWDSWTVPTIALTSAVLMLVLAFMVFWHRQPAPLPPSPKQRALQDPFEQGSFRERRASLRRRGKITQVLISNADATAEPFPGLVFDRSLTGLRIAVCRAVEKNKVLSVRVVDSRANSEWIQVEVKRCRVKDEESWELGCQFLRTPPYGQLLLFG
jgi:hypothetical protein